MHRPPCQFYSFYDTGIFRGVMIFRGHFSAQTPQLVHFCASMCARKLVTLMAPASQLRSHSLQPIQPTRHTSIRDFPLSFELHCTKRLLVIRNQLDQLLRAGRDTFSAGLALFLIHHRNPFHDVDCVKGTRLHAGAVASTP